MWKLFVKLQATLMDQVPSIIELNYTVSLKPKMDELYCEAFNSNNTP